MSGVKYVLFNNCFTLEMPNDQPEMLTDEHLCRISQFVIELIELIIYVNSRV